MLDRKVVKELIEDELKDIEIPKDISKDELIEAFCIYMENDYYDWFKDNFKSFFNYGDPDWNWIKKNMLDRELL